MRIGDIAVLDVFDAGRLHRILLFVGLSIDEDELDAALIGATTVDAFGELQERHGLRRTAEIDEADLVVLLDLEASLDAAPPRPAREIDAPAKPDDRGVVIGSVVDADGRPLARAPVALLRIAVRGSQQIARTTTSNDGSFQFRYHRRPSQNLAVRAYDPTGRQLVQSATTFAAAAHVTIDLTTAPDGVIRPPAEFVTLGTAVAAALDTTPLTDLRQDKDHGELMFLADDVNVAFAAVAALYVAEHLAATHDLLPATLFGLFRQGTPPALAAALGQLPDAGIDTSFAEQVFAGVVTLPSAALAKALTAAIAANILPASFAEQLPRQIARLHALHTTAVAAAPYVRGKTSLGELLVAGRVAAPVQGAFVAAYAAHAGALGPTWKALRADASLGKADLAALNIVLSAGELLGGNVRLLRDTQDRLATGALGGLRDLARLDEAGWVARIREVDAEAETIPQVLPDDQPGDRITRFAKALRQRFAGRFPTTAFLGGLDRAGTAAPFAEREKVAGFLDANPRFNFRRSNIDHFIAQNKVELSPAAVDDLKTIQRLYRVSPHYASVAALHRTGLTSAQSIYFKGRAPFISEMSEALGSPAIARTAYARAQVTYASALAVFGRYTIPGNGAQIAGLASTKPDPQTIAGFPDLQALFGSLDYFDCEACQSVYSPAAYLVDLLQYLAGLAARPVAGAVAPVAAVATARDALLLRRPDIAVTALSCNNTTIVIPYIDVVNEVLEAAVAPAAIARPTLIETVGSTAERRALPQEVQPAVAAAAYAATTAAIFPIGLPFDADFARTGAYIKGLGTSRAALMRLFPAAGDAATIAAVRLGLNPALRAMITTVAAAPAARWGLASNPASVVDPKTRLAYSPTPADWVAALNKVPVLLDRARLELPELYQLIEVAWVTSGAVSLAAGTEITGGIEVLSADTDKMTFTGLTAAVLDRANRFVRLWRATGLPMWELDWALSQFDSAVMDDASLVFLSEVIVIRQRLGLPLQEVLTFYATIETRSVPNHLGEVETVVPATYQAIFATPTMLASWRGLFGDPATLKPPSPLPQLSFPASASPTPAQLEPLGGVVAALGMTNTDIAAVLAATGAANVLGLPTLTVLTRYARLASALALAVPDLIVWIRLTAQNPFAGAPADTTEFLRRLDILQASGIAIGDLDYLLCGQSPAQSAIASADAAGAVLQSVRDAIAKTVTSGAMAIVKLTNSGPVRIVTAKPHGLVTGNHVFVSGVGGTTAANGKFAVTVTAGDTTGLLLDGSVGNAAWSGGGSVVAEIDVLIAPVVVAALADAAAADADVIVAALRATGLLPLDATTMAALLATPTPTAVAFPAMATAFTRVAKAAALATKLAIAPDNFEFVVEQATRFGWQNPVDLPIAPVATSAYTAVEKLLHAVALQRRQSGRATKLFDVLATWVAPGGLPADVATAIAGRAAMVAGATDAVPIVVTTTAPHGLATGTTVEIAGVGGNTAANGTFAITVTAPDAFALDSATGNGAWTGGGSVTDRAAPRLAAALGGSVGDVSTIAAALGAGPPGALPGGAAGTLADMALLTALAAALDVAARYGIDALTLVQLGAPVATPATAKAATAAFQKQYSPSAWLGAVQPIEDSLRHLRRDALVAQLLGAGPAPASLPGAAFFTTNDLFNYFLIDPEMCACGQTTRLLQPSLAIQQLVQQGFLNLVINATLDMTDPRWAEWSWRQQYRLWQANREVFLYPENYVLPELRTSASPFFKDLENDLRQTTCDHDAAEAAFGNYLRKLVGVARLVIAAHYNAIKPDGSSVLHVFARTRAAPYKWYYRTRATLAANAGTGLPPAGSWNAWHGLNLDITADQVVPVIWDRRLYLIWPIFKQVTQKQDKQSVPTAGGNTVAPPHRFWSIQIGMSESSAGQWQPKRTYDEKFYIDSEDPPSSFMFKASEDAEHNLIIAVFHHDSASSALTFKLVAEGMLPLPDAAIAIIEHPVYRPSPSEIDLSQEPSFALLTQSHFIKFNGLNNEPVPTDYSFKGQDLTFGGWAAANPPGPVALNVLSIGSKTTSPASLEVLGAITNPRIVVPQQELVFDSADPFFVADHQRAYLVQPHYFTVSSSPVELGDLTYVKNWTTRYQFETFYHPYALTFLRELEIGGVPRLLARSLQLQPETVRGLPAVFDFKTQYLPRAVVQTPYPGAVNAPDPGERALDFDAGSSGAYSLYNWELFYHGPMFVAAQLLQNQKFEEALDWLKYIFDPTDRSGGATPQRFWQMAPLNAMNAADWTNQQIEHLLGALAGSKQLGINDPATQNAILAWMADPYDPHAVASTRISAYGRATVMKFLDVVIAWGDSYYAQYTAETVGQAEQLYIMADMILGPKPDRVRRPAAQQAAPTTYAQLQTLDLFSNTLVNVENVVIAPQPPQALVQGLDAGPSLPHFPGTAEGLLFCIPPNAQLMNYWGKVEQRLYNIRHCLNLQGVAQPLPLYAPRIDPLQLIAAKAGGATSFGGGAPAPIYRFDTYVRKALDLASDVRSYGDLILAALEKQDAETLAALRAQQEADIQTRMLDIKTGQVVEAADQITVLQNQLAVTRVRQQYYASRQFMNGWETAAMTLQGGALIANGFALILDLTAGAAHLAPTVTGGAAGFGGSPLISVAYGGDNIASSASSWASVARGLGGLLSEASGMASTVGGYKRREDDWAFQATMATAEITQIDSQISAATDHLTTAKSEIAVQQRQIANAVAVDDFLTAKYTSAQLYSWMTTQLGTVHAQAYQLAYSLAQQAQTAYRYELGRPLDQFIQPAYWDSQRKGLTAGDSLLLDLRRMEAQFLANNLREQEVTRHISLALTQPAALVALLETGSCTIALDESLFDHDHPGQYFRRLRSVAVTVPCVTGPYTGVNATLSLGRAVTRTAAPQGGYQPWRWADAATNADPDISASPAVAAVPVIAISTGQNDAGLFEPRLTDDRWLPFEGQGAVSSWTLTLDPRDNAFDLSSITDIILHLRYTARGGGDAEAVRTALKPASSRTILISARNTFGDAYYAFFNPPDAASPTQTLQLKLTDALFPFSNLGRPRLKTLNLVMPLAEPLAPALVTAMGGGLKLDATFGATGVAPPVALSFVPVAQAAAGGGIVAALSTGDVALAAPTAPGSFDVTIVRATLPATLRQSIGGHDRLDPAKVSDILLLVTYDLL